MKKQSKQKKQKYQFWRWLILSVVHIRRLYWLVWGALIVLLLIGLKVNIATIVASLWP